MRGFFSLVSFFFPSVSISLENAMQRSSSSILSQHSHGFANVMEVYVHFACSKIRKHSTCDCTFPSAIFVSNPCTHRFNTSGFPGRANGVDERDGNNTLG